MKFEQVLVVVATLAVTASAIFGTRTNKDIDSNTGKNYTASNWSKETSDATNPTLQPFIDSITGDVSLPIIGQDYAKCVGTGGRQDQHNDSLARRYCEFDGKDRCCTTSHDEFISHAIEWESVWPAACKDDKIPHKKDLYCMVCDPEQPLWTQLPDEDTNTPAVVRICESMLRTFYGEDNLDAPTYAFNECGAWDDPDPEYTEHVILEDDENYGHLGLPVGTVIYEEYTKEPELIFPGGEYANATDLFHNWEQAKIPFFPGYTIQAVPDFDIDGNPNVCYSAASNLIAAAILPLISAFLM